MQTPASITSDSIISLRPQAEALSLKIGDIVNAEVINVMDSGSVSLRIIADNSKSGIILALSSIPLTKGENLSLKVMGGSKDIRLQLIERSEFGIKQPEPLPENIPAAILKMFSEISDSKLKNSDINLFKQMLKSLPDSIKTFYYEFEALEKFMPEIEKLNAHVLKTSVEGSGVLFETRLKFAAEKPQILSEPDQKGLLIRLREIFKNDYVSVALRSSGFDSSEMQNAIDRMIRNIEFFQLSSRINDALYTFLPVDWKELKDGEISFKKKNKGNKSYMCEINLDLDSMGKLSVSVMIFEGAFYITFNAEKPETMSMIDSERPVLKKKFSDAGLSLKVVNISQRKDISFGIEKEEGLNLRI